MKKCVCTKCGHSWMPRVEGLPLQCPQCHNPKWWAKRTKEGVIKEIKNVKGK